MKSSSSMSPASLWVMRSSFLMRGRSRWTATDISTMRISIRTMTWMPVFPPWMTGAGELVELQGTGEGRPFTIVEQRALVELCAKGIRELQNIQRQVLGG